MASISTMSCRLTSQIGHSAGRIRGSSRSSFHWQSGDSVHGTTAATTSTSTSTLSPTSQTYRSAAATILRHQHSLSATNGGATATKQISRAIHQSARRDSAAAVHLSPSLTVQDYGSGASSSSSSSSTIHPKYLLPAAAAAAMLSFITAITATDTNSATGSTTRITTSKIPRGGGGGGSGSGGSGGSATAPHSLSTRQDTEMAEEEDDMHKPLAVSVGAYQGARWTMEDEYRIAANGRFAACFDGHGGNAVSAYLRDNMYELYRNFVKQKHWEEEETYRTPSVACHVAALRGALKEIDRRVLLNDRINTQGSTAVAVVVHVGENGQRTLLSANVGDSRAILSRDKKAVNLTRDHKPNDVKERERILALGEEVKWDPLGHVHRVRNLSLSRAIGDSYAKPVVSGVPEIQHFPLIEDESNDFILLASDGLWDVMTSQEVVDFIHETMQEDIKTASQQQDTTSLNHLLRRTMARRVAKEAIIRGSGDNVCVVMVWLSDVEASSS